MKVELIASIWTGSEFEERSIVMEVHSIEILYENEVNIFHSDKADFGLSVNEYNEVNFDFEFNRVFLEIVNIES